MFFLFLELALSLSFFRVQLCSTRSKFGTTSKMVHNLFSPVFVVNFREKLSYFRRFYSRKSYKVLFFGSEGIALKSLRKINDFRKQEKLIERLDLVTANSSKNRTVIEKYALEENIRTIPWPLQQLQDAEYDVGLIVAFGHLIRNEVLSKFPLGMINVHPSLLPRWRGAAPIIHTLLHGDPVTGVTLMKIKADEFDVGEIISQQSVPVPSDIKLPELTEQLSEIGADMLVECLRCLPTCLENATPQSSEGITYAKKIDKSISDVKWLEMDAIQVYNLYRALYGLYPLTTKFRDKPMKLFDAFLDNTESIDTSKLPGTLEYCERTNSIRILCRDKQYIHFKSLRIVGKRKITALDFYNGYIKNVPEERRQYVVC